MTSDNGWESIAESIRPVLDDMHKTREVALQRCRALIQTSAKAIRHMHRRDFETAETLLGQALAAAKEARAGLAGHPNLLYAGYLQDAEKEAVEAMAVLAIIRGSTLLAPAEMGVDVTSYLNGMGEAASECRRYVLDEMRKGSLPEAERILRAMEDIYDDLITYDYSDAMTGGLRRTCDALRAVIERTRGDLTMTQSQRELLNELRESRKA